MILRPLKAWIVAAGLLTLPGVAMADIFMLVTGLAGDATAKNHENWIRVSSLEWKVTSETSWTKGGGASVGKPNPDSLQLVLPTGPWSAQLMKSIGQGGALPVIVFDAVASDGRPLYRITAEGFFVTQYQLASLPTTPLPQDRVNGVFRKIKIEYYAIGADGKLVTSFVEWEITTGKVTSSPAQ